MPTESKVRTNVGEPMAGSRTPRAGTKRTAVRRRAVGTRDKIIAHLASITQIMDPAGMASTKLAEAVSYPGSSVAFAQLLSGMERDGLIVREVRGKRTYRITLADGTMAAAGAATTAGAAGAVSAVSGHARGANTPANAAAGGRALADAGSASAAQGFGVAADSMAAIGADPATASPASGAGFDYDELARRLLIQVVRRLAATPTDLEQTVAGLEQELVTAWTRHGTLTAENVRLREQLREAQRNLELLRQRTPRLEITDELDKTEVVVLERLLSPDRDDEGATASPLA